MSAQVYAGPIKKFQPYCNGPRAVLVFLSELTDITAKPSLKEAAVDQTSLRARTVKLPFPE